MTLIAEVRSVVSLRFLVYLLVPHPGVAICVPCSWERLDILFDARGLASIKNASERANPVMEVVRVSGMVQ